MPLPDCDRCSAAESLEVIRADTRGLKWAYCRVCSKTVLLDAENRILKHGD
jgi:hypothetical protein